jgi:hypothetical protein
MQDSPLPQDLAHPRRERAHLIANLTTATIGLAAVVAVIIFALVAR